MAKKKNPHAVALGRKGGKKGGIVRAAMLTDQELSEIGKAGARARNDSLSPKERSALAKKAAKARWGGKRKKE